MRLRQTTLVFDLDGTLVDSVYQHVLAWHEALQDAGIELSVWRIHRRIGMSGGLFTRAVGREIGHELTDEEASELQAQRQALLTSSDASAEAFLPNW